MKRLTLTMNPKPQANTETHYQGANVLWANMRREAETLAAREPILKNTIQSTILDHDYFALALAFRLASELSSTEVPATTLHEVIKGIYKDHPTAWQYAESDMLATRTRDAACESYVSPLLFFKGYQALQAYRVAHCLWHDSKTMFASYIQAHCSTRFNVDIHPAARIGQGIMLDHASGIVIGETAVVDDNVSMLQGVTLGGTGKETGDRHPKIGKGVLIGSGAKILGNITIGEGAKIGAGSVVLKDIPAHTTAAGVPAKVIGKPPADSDDPALTMDHSL